MLPSKSWATQGTRQKHIVKLRSALMSCGRVNENVEDIEQKIMDKSNSLEEYLHNLSKVLVHCQNSMGNRPMQQNLQLQQSMQMQQMHMASAAQGMVGGPGMGGPIMQAGPPNLQALPPQPGGGPGPPGGVMMSQGPGGGMVVSMRGYGPGAPGDDPERRAAMFAPTTSTASAMDEDTLYMMKLQELQRKYIVPLQKLKDRGEKKKAGPQTGDGGQLKRIDEILDILHSSKKIKMESLKTIEGILFKLFDNKGNTPEIVGSVEKLPSSSSGVIGPAPGSLEKPTGGGRNIHFCQPLIDAVASHARNASFYHTVKRTFGPSLYSHYGSVTSYPPAKRPKKGDLTMPMMVDSEIERLPAFFKADLRNRDRGDLEVVVKHKTYHIAPKITMVIPTKYPDQSPWVKDSQNKLGKEVESALKDRLVTLPVTLTLTQILLAWDFCMKRVLRQRAPATS